MKLIKAIGISAALRSVRWWTALIDQNLTRKLTLVFTPIAPLVSRTSN